MDRLLINDVGYSLSKIQPDGTVSPFASGLITPFGLTIDDAGNLYAADVGLNMISRITPSGAVSPFVSGLPTYPMFLAFGPVAVPEPGPLALLLGMGLMGAGLLMRRRKK